VIYNPNFTRMLAGTAIPGTRFEADEKRLVIEYGTRLSGRGGRLTGGWSPRMPA
jgi:hypothetical protein